MPETIRGAIEKNVEERPDKPFLHFEDKTYTYERFNATANRAANAFLGLGVKKGEKVCLLLGNVPEFLFSFFGITKIGAVCGPINPACKADEVKYMLNLSDAVVLVADEAFDGMIESIRGDCPALRRVVLTCEADHATTLSFDRLIESASSENPPVEVAPDDVAAIIYTSGTTGNPKGVLLTHANYISDSESIVRHIRMTDEDRFMCILPLFHVNGQVATTLSPLIAGGSMVLVRRFSASTFFENVDKYKPTAFSAVPTIYAILLNRPDVGDYDLSSLRFCICGAAPMPVEVFRRFEEKFNAKILEGYGLSEGTCASTVNPIGGTRKVGSIGIPLPGQDVEIFDDGDRPLPAGERGEIVVRGPVVMKGYYKNPEATADALKNGWLHTGDIGYRDEDGYFYIVGRKKEMIIRGGENIYPKEIEEVLYKHPGIAEAAVCGVPHDFYGEEVKAFVVLKDRETMTEQEVIDWCRERLADYKCPKTAAFMKEFPKTPTGKIQKRKLVETQWQAE
ncbi:MAG: long-chain fatty acid--CoA ligase [bacterium]